MVAVQILWLLHCLHEIYENYFSMIILFIRSKIYFKYKKILEKLEEIGYVSEVEVIAKQLCSEEQSCFEKLLWCDV